MEHTLSFLPVLGVGFTSPENSWESGSLQRDGEGQIPPGDGSSHPKTSTTNKPPLAVPISGRAQVTWPTLGA